MSGRPAVRHLTTWQIFAVPVLIAVVTAAGLIFALVGDGIWDAISWLLLFLPVAIPVVCLLRAR